MMSFDKFNVAEKIVSSESRRINITIMICVNCIDFC